MREPSFGLVLSGGGARGAYEVGVVKGILDVLAAARHPATFRIVVGTSVGAINGTYLAANAHLPAHDIGGLMQVWKSLSVERHLRVDVAGMVGFTSPFRWFKRTPPDLRRLGRSILNPAPIEELVRTSINWDQLHKNFASGTMHALVVATLHVGSGVTCLFAELGPGATFSRNDTARVVARREMVTAEHVLASAAIPALYPARRLGDSYFVDGGLRFNTPIASAIHAGADRLVIVSTAHQRAPPAQGSALQGDGEKYPGTIFLLGKVLDALMVDPMETDLVTLSRVNQLMDAVEATFSDEQIAALNLKLGETRSAPYRRIDTLVIAPSEDIGRLAARHIRDHLETWSVGRFLDTIGRAAAGSKSWEADLASYLMFDGSWAKELIELGQRDVAARADEVREFYLGFPRR